MVRWPGLMLVGRNARPARCLSRYGKEIGGSENVELAYEAARPTLLAGASMRTCAVPSHLVVDREQAGKLIGIN